MSTAMVWRSLVIAALVLAAARLSASDPTPLALRAPLETFPRTIGDWRGADLPPLEPEVLRILGADDHLNRVYERADGAIAGVYVAYYGAQQQGDSIHSPQHCLPGNGWQPVSRSRVPLQLDGRQVPVNRYVVARHDVRQIVFYWFEGRGRVVASEYLNKWFLLADGFRLRRSEGALVRLVTPLPPGGRHIDPSVERAADEVLQQLGRSVHTTLSRWLP